MGITILKRSTPKEKSARVSTGGGRAPFLQNDLLLATRKTKDGQKDIFILSKALFESTGLNSKESAAIIGIDADSNQAFLIAVPASSEYAEVLKARNGEKFNKKSEEFLHKNLIDFFVKNGVVSESRTIGDGFGFALTSKPEKLSEVEGATAIYEITPTALVGRAAKKVESGTEEVSNSSEEVETVEETPVLAAEPVAETQDDWDE